MNLATALAALRASADGGRWPDEAPKRPWDKVFDVEDILQPAELVKRVGPDGWEYLEYVVVYRYLEQAKKAGKPVLVTGDWDTYTALHHAKELFRDDCIAFYLFVDEATHSVPILPYVVHHALTNDPDGDVLVYSVLLELRRLATDSSIARA
jgi:hypothetical protein